MSLPVAISTVCRKAILICTLFLSGLLTKGYSQQLMMDSLRHVLAQDKTDTARLYTILGMARAAQSYGPDSVWIYLDQAKKFLSKVNSPEGQMQYWRFEGFGFEKIGNFPRALENYLSALQLAEKINNINEVNVASLRLGSLYADQQDFEKASYYLHKSYKLTTESDLKKPEGSVFEYATLGNCYMKMGRLDTALTCMQKAYEDALKFKVGFRMPSILTVLGQIHEQLGNYGLAMEYHRQSNFIGKQLFGESTTIGYPGIARIFLLQGKKDSAIYYAYKRHYGNTVTRDLLEISKSALFLSGIYDSLGKMDSAYHYLAVNKTANDSLFARDNRTKLTNLTFNEQLRQRDLDELERKAKEERLTNLRLLGIGVFLIFFILVVLLLSRARIRPRVVEFLGLISVLLLFEFIALFIHPYIGNWTHHNPVLMLIILAGIAAILVPLHHRATHWVKQNLPRKPKPKSTSIPEPEAEKVID